MELRDELDPKVAEYLDMVVRWVYSMSFDQLLRAIYHAYPTCDRWERLLR